jgi:hypothetical protein
MTKQERADKNRVDASLIALGFSKDECNKLRRISNTLRRWYELNCNEDMRQGFMRDGILVDCANPEECKRLGQTCKTYITKYATMRGGKDFTFAIRNNETAAIKRLDAMISKNNAAGKTLVAYYLQTDPRGAALYVIPMSRYEDYCGQTNRKPDGKFDAIYTSVGICVS